jgi:poly-gamma-glutamate synthesis protein (capsule biosynthesis protein)
VVLTRHGVRFGFGGFNAIGETPQATGTAPGALSVRMPPRTGPLDRADLAHVLALVRDLRRRADVVVAIPHWGDQYTHAAEPVQSLVGRRLVRAGADLVVGGHPHWVQGLEHVPTRAGGAVLAHSLGNLVFDMDFMDQTMEGVTLTATFWGDRLMRVDLTPYRMDARFAPHLVDGPVAAGILADVWDHSTGPFARR